MLALTTSARCRDWPKERYAEVCKKLLQTHDDIEIILVGNGEVARNASNAFMHILPQAHDFTDKTSIRETIALFKKANYYLGGDTGPMHIACACGLKGVAIYKNPKDQRPDTYNPTKVLYPWQVDIRVVQPEHAMVGCEDGCCHEEPHCILQVSVDTVYEAMNSVIVADTI